MKIPEKLERKKKPHRERTSTVLMAITIVFFGFR